MPSNAHGLPDRIAVAGGWGYIGRKVVNAALELGIEVCVLDPAPFPEELHGVYGLRIYKDPEAFYALPAGFFHLALHPHMRAAALEHLFKRAARGEAVYVLNEKPMTAPETPWECHELIKLAEASRIYMAFDFLELFDPMTQHIMDYLSGFNQVQFTRISLHRSKDRENPDNPRNYKVITPIPYQETVHDFAFLLAILGHTHPGGLPAVLEQPLSLQGKSEPYIPPNPADYPYMVDGRTEGCMALGKAKAHFYTDFKAGAPFQKTKILEGMADNTPFRIEANYLEGAKYLRINSEDQGFAPDSNTYQAIIRQLWRWRNRLQWETFTHGLYPNMAFARWTYLLSAALWDACHSHQTVLIPGKNALLSYAPSFPAAVRKLPAYAARTRQEMPAG